MLGTEDPVGAQGGLRPTPGNNQTGRSGWNLQYS